MEAAWPRDVDKEGDDYLAMLAAFFFMTVVASVEIVCCLWLCGGGLGLILAKAIACLEPC